MKTVHLPLTHALAWIIASILVITCPSYAIMKWVLSTQRTKDAAFVLRRIIQTGPQKEALKTEYLAEWLGLCSDLPCNVKHFTPHSVEKQTSGAFTQLKQGLFSRARYNCRLAKQRLLKSPLISRAEVKWIKPETLYIDYTIRQPIAWLEDYDNIVFDKEGFPFPLPLFLLPRICPQSTLV